MKKAPCCGLRYIGENHNPVYNFTRCAHCKEEKIITENLYTEGEIHRAWLKASPIHPDESNLYKDVIKELIRCKM